MDVAEVLRRAADAVDRSGVSGDLRAVAFTAAVDLVLRTSADRAAGPAGSGAAGPALAAPALDGHALDGHRAGPSRERQPSFGAAPVDGAARPARDGDGEPAWDLDEGAEHRGGWHQPPRVLRPLSSAAVQRPGPRLALRADDDGPTGRGPERPGDLAAVRRGPDRLVSVGPRAWPAAPGAGEEPWGSIADALGVRPELLDRVWEERGGVLQLAGDPARFGRTRAQRVGTAAVLLLAALRWSGRDGGEPVPDAVVRAEVERLGLLDTGNYTKHLAGRRHLLSTTGSGRTATYKLRYDGLEEARVIARALLEEG